MTVVEPAFADLWQAPADPALALLFPGQGSQQVGMGRALYEASPAARHLMDTAQESLGIPLLRLMFEGPAEELTDTANAQPAIFVASLACLAAAMEAKALPARPAFVAGHSLGEYTALVAAGALSFVDALALVRRRGELMAQAGRERPGTMAAIMGLDDGQLEAICRDTGAQVCNYNCPGQTVIGGSVQAVAEATARAKALGAKVVPLRVSGAFHTSLMAPAAEALARAIDDASLRDALVPVVGNACARPLVSASELAAELKAQLTRPVLWKQSLQAMACAGVVRFLEVGPGGVLTGLVRRTLPQAQALSIDGPESLEALQRWWT
ncbi:MAG: ACP S-malonyltransferase [Dehalococcoidia bacterium]|jgi:[acyl-carrier-protein] S-malonyltransferase|nr:ACP S-malonyltransferase [Dehalococcoidia bacterium]MDW8008620.1 ACP S-malonyltransferase [Chloroflexota bacterium]